LRGGNPLGQKTETRRVEEFTMSRSSLVLGLTLAVGVVCAARSFAVPADEDARGLVKRVIDAAPDVPYVSRMELTTPGGLVREFTLSGKTLADGIDARYLEVTGPFNLKDTRYLFYDRRERQDDQFMYVPFMKRVVRLSEKTRREPFLGSTFYVNDIVEPSIDNYTYAFVGTDTVGQRTCQLVESLPKNAESETYGKSVIAIDPIDLVVLRAQLYDHDGKLLKVHTVDKLEKVEGYWTPRMQTMQNVQEAVTSELETLEIQYNAPIGDEVFREAHLGR
jgi:outer membrane lipoprotein-sorting protein